jgi:hypothetical protein
MIVTSLAFTGARGSVTDRRRGFLLRKAQNNTRMVRLGRRSRRERTRVSQFLRERALTHMRPEGREDCATQTYARNSNLNLHKNVEADAAETHSPDSLDDFLLEVLRWADCLLR